MILTSSFQKIAEEYVGNTGYGNVYLQLYGRVSSQGYDVENNRTKVYAKSVLVVEGNGNYFYSGPVTTKGIYIAGVGANDNVNAEGTYYQGSTTIQELSGWVSHNADGTKNVGIDCKFYSQPWGWNAIPTAYVDLPKIPRQASITKFQIESRTLNTLTFSWAADKACDAIQYSLNNGSWVNGSFPNTVIRNLAPNAPYSLKIRVKAQDSQLWTESSVINTSTLMYATMTGANNFNDEQNPSFTFSQTGAGTLSVWLELNPVGDHLCVRNNIPNTGSYTWSLTEEEKTELRKRCTKPSCVCRIGIYTIEGANSYPSFKDITFSIVNGNPTFNDFEWEITNYSELTGNNNTAIKGFSSIKTKISNTNKAVTRKEASLISYKTVIGTKNKTNSNLIYPVETIVNNVDSGTIQVYANDSRGNSTKVEKTISNFIDLLPLNINRMEVKRSDNNDEEVNLKIEGVIDTVDFGQVVNAINRSRYYYKLKDSSTYIEGATNLQFTYEKITGTQHKFFINQTIEGDIEDGFSSNGEYDIKVTISDKLTEVTKETSLEQGSPAIAILGNNIALGAPYNEKVGGRVQINGQVAKDMVSVQTEEPNSNVWIQKSKNLFNKQEYVQSDKKGIRLKGVLKVGQTYTVSFENLNNTTYGFTTKVGSGDATSSDVFETWTNKPFSFVYTQAMYNNNYMLYILNATDYYPISYDQMQSLNLQIEQGETATEYEEYADKKIYTKNDNGIYDIFYDETNVEIYSLNERRIGTWVDGKPLYRKVKVLTPTTQSTDFGGVGETNVGKIISAKGMAYRPSAGYYNIIPCTYTNWEIFLYDITKSYGRLVFSSNQWGAGVGECILIFEYTKTTD